MLTPLLTNKNRLRTRHRRQRHRQPRRRHPLHRHAAALLARPTPGSGRGRGGRAQDHRKGRAHGGYRRRGEHTGSGRCDGGGVERGFAGEDELVGVGFFLGGSGWSSASRWGLVGGGKGLTLYWFLFTWFFRCGHHRGYIRFRRKAARWV